MLENVLLVMVVIYALVKLEIIEHQLRKLLYSRSKEQGSKEDSVQRIKPVKGFVGKNVYSFTS